MALPGSPGARGAGTHGDVLSGHTPYTTPHHTTPQHHDHNTTRRQRQRKKTDRERREDEREEDKTKEEIRFISSVAVHGRS